jgi:hypothetical protein
MSIQAAVRHVDEQYAWPRSHDGQIAKPATTPTGTFSIARRPRRQSDDVVRLDTRRNPCTREPTGSVCRSTALFGMTRTGKSNTTKIVLKTIFELRWQPAALRIGHVIFDPNGECANEHAQDAGEP